MMTRDISEFITDMSARRALEASLGHPAPFTVDECAQYSSTLSLLHVRDISWLQYLPSLTHLEIHACEVTDYEVIRKLTQLKILSLKCSPCDSLEFLDGCPNLETLEVSFTYVQDLRPILRLNSLRNVLLQGNPILEEQWRHELVLLAITPSPRWGKPPLILTESDGSMATTRRLHRHGIQLCYTCFDDRYSVVVRPGFGIVPGSDCDAIWERTDFTYTEFIHKKAVYHDKLILDLLAAPKNQPCSLAELKGERVIGDAETALGWINGSTLPEHEKGMLRSFVAKFPGVTFYKESQIGLDYDAAQLPSCIGNGPDRKPIREVHVEIPSVIREMFTVLAGVYPGYRPGFQFDSFEYPRHFKGEWLFRWWFRIFVGGFSGINDYKLLIEDCDKFLCGQADSFGYPGLLTTYSDATDRSVYIYDTEYMDDAVSEGRHPSEEVYPAFDSLASLYSHVIAIRFDNEMTILAPGVVLKTEEDHYKPKVVEPVKAVEEIQKKDKVTESMEDFDYLDYMDYEMSIEYEEEKNETGNEKDIDDE